MRRETSRAIDDAAATWAAKADKGELPPEQQARLDAWLAGDSRRLGAFARARAIALRSERAHALGPSYRPDRFNAARRSRHGAWPVAAGLAATLAVVAGLTAWSQRDLPVIPFIGGAREATVVETARGDLKLVRLADGSTVSLNTASRLVPEYTADRRTVRLLAGEAFFQVRGGERPFVVEAGDTFVRAVGTRFIVRRLSGQPVEVLVEEGSVQITRRSAPEAPAVVAAANTRAVAAQESGVAVVSSLTPASVERELAWRERNIEFQGEALADAAAEFDRYNETVIVVADAELARETVTGLFSARDPIGFAQAAAASLDATARVERGRVVLDR